MWEDPVDEPSRSCPPSSSLFTHRLAKSTVVLPSWPAGQRTRWLPASPWHKTNLSAFICVGGSPLKALLQDWRSPISTISFWQAAGGVTWHQLCTDGTWQAHRSVKSAITGGKLVAGWTGEQRCNSWIKQRDLRVSTQDIDTKEAQSLVKAQVQHAAVEKVSLAWY